MEEVWRPVVGHEDGYEVSNLGRVRSIGRLVETASGARKYKGVIRKQSLGSHGYMVVSLSRVGRVVVECVHRLVLEAFVGPCPEGMEACHGPEGAFDNSVGNLRWDTRLENLRDQDRHGTRALGEVQSKWSRAEILRVRELLLDGLGQTEIERITGIPKETVNAVKHGKTWRHLNV